MWNIDAAFETPATPIAIEPKNVLYYFDGPQIFQTRFGFLDAIFVKVDEYETSDLWLASMTDTKTIGLVEANRLSVRGAFLGDQCWIVQTDYDMNVERYWSVGINEVPESLLPHPGAALAFNAPRAPDTIEQSTSLFSIGFKGKSLSKQGMPLSVFRGLVNGFGDIARAILTPAELTSTRSATFDYLVREPKFNSLVVSVTDPIINLEKIQQKLGSDEVTTDSISVQIKAQREAFFADLESAISQAKLDKKTRSISAGDRELVNKLQYFIPGDASDIESIEFTAAKEGEFKNVFIDREEGSKIHEAFFEESYRDTIRAGTIVEINDESHTFLIKGAKSRITTCIPNAEIYEWLMDQDAYINGSRIAVKGAFQQRTYRDRIYVNEVKFLKSA